MISRTTTLALLLVLVAACQAGAPPESSPSPSPTTPPAPAGLNGRIFLSTSVKKAGADFPLVPNTQIRLSFQDGALGASAGCNSMSGPYVLDGNRLLVQQMGMTEMACDPDRQAQDDWLSDILGSQPTLALNGNDLTVTAGDTVITLLDREIANPDMPLAGTVWTVDSIISGDAVSSVPQGAVATLQINDDGSLTLNTGCNSGGGRVAREGDQLLFSDIFTTKRACGGPEGQLEGAVLAVLDAGQVAFSIDADSLTLQAGQAGLGLRGGAPPPQG